MKEQKIVITLDELGHLTVDRFNISINDSISLLDLSRAQLRIEKTRNEEQTNDTLNKETKKLNYPLQHIYPY